MRTLRFAYRTDNVVSVREKLIQIHIASLMLTMKQLLQLT